MGSRLNFINNKSSKIYNTGNEDALSVVDDFDHIEDVEQDILETITAEVTAESLNETISDAIDDIANVQQGEFELDLVEDVNNNYEAIVTDDPDVVTANLVKVASETIIYRLSNNLAIPPKPIENKITRSVAREASLDGDGYDNQLSVLVGSTKNYIEEIRSDYMNIVASLFDKNLKSTNIVKLHANKMRMLKTVLNGNRNSRVVDRAMFYAPISAAYNLCGGSVNEVVTYISNMSMRPVDTIAAGIKNGDTMEAFSAAAAMLNAEITSNVITSTNASSNGVNFVTSILGNVAHIVNVYPTDIGIRYSVLELPFGSAYTSDLNPTPISADEIRDIISNIVYCFQNFETIQAEVIESIGSVASLAKSGSYDPGAVKAAMAVTAKTAKGILHAYTYGISKVLNICIAEAMSNA